MPEFLDIFILMSIQKFNAQLNEHEKSFITSRLGVFSSLE